MALMKIKNKRTLELSVQIKHKSPTLSRMTVHRVVSRLIACAITHVGEHNKTFCQVHTF